MRNRFSALAATLALAMIAASLPVASVRATSHSAAGIESGVYEASITDLQRAMAEGRMTSRQIVEAYLRRIAAYDRAGPELNSIVTLNQNALAEADALDRERRSKGPRGPLHGIPILVKDNFDVAGMPTSGGTLALAGLQATQDAFLVARLRRAGAVILGKTAMHELAFGVTTISSLTGITRNPYDLRRSPGGSSGGSAVAVAASFAAAAMGTDTCGSIRVPAAAANLYGIRESTGLSGRSGILPLSTTQDVAGPIARSVTDLAIMMDATVARDESDPATFDAVRAPQSYVSALRPGGLVGARIGVLKSLLDPQATEPNIVKTIDSALALMKAQGAILVDISIPELEAMSKEANVTAFEFQPAIADYLSKHAGAPIRSVQEIIDQGLDHEAIDEVLRARIALSGDAAAYRRAFDKRSLVRKTILDAMASARVDVLAYPVQTQSPPMWGTSLYGRSTCQFSASTGLPAIAIPLGLADTTLPVGLDLLGRSFEEPRLLRLAFAWEQTAKPRIAPSSTPPLVNGAAPRARFATVRVPRSGAASASASIAFRYDVATSILSFNARIDTAGQDLPVALTLHKGTDMKPGPVIAVLTLKGVRHRRGEIYVDPTLREALLSQGVYAQLFTVRNPLGGARSRIALR